MKRGARWFGMAFVALPITVLAHECGHLGGAAACGLGGLRLHYASMTYSLEPAFWSAYRTAGLGAAAGVVAPWRVAVAVSGGLLVTYLMTVVGLTAARRSPGGWGAAATVAAGSRAVPVALSMAATARSVAFRGTDEAQCAALTGLPESVLVLFALGALVGSSWWAFARCPREHRLVMVVATLAGVGAGVPAYVLVGRHLLP
jgi:hypothetical protein